ncbi:MAG: hemerythrin domain-containing protein [Chitinophagaceae bacterium]|nr:hemerythrin domain-containing protein [Chitinophagaceae bacterium]
MKRHESIVPLSRDHHFGLLCCWKIRQGIKNEISLQRIHSYIQYFWSHHLKEHFEEEENFLFSALQSNMTAQAIGEHRELEASVLSLSANASPDAFLQFAQQLDDHIRFEERELFPYLEKTLPAEQLDVIGRQIQEIHSNEKEDDYEDEFWVKSR